MSSRSLFTSLLFTASAALVSAQAPAPALVESYSTRVGYSSDADIGGASVAVSHFEAAINGRFAAGSAGMGLTGLNFKTYLIDATGLVPVPDSLQEASLTLGLQRQLSPTWSAMAVLKPGFYGDFEDLDGDSFNAPFLFMANYATKEELVWTFGLNVNLFSENPVLPLVGVRWRFAPDWTLAVAFPRTAVSYQASKALTYSVGIRFEGGNYRITESPLPTLGGARLNDTYLDFTEIRVGAGASLALTETMKLELEAGVMTDRKFDYFDRDFTLNGDAGAFVSLSLNGRF
ncbi:MAG TPA: DUF6268 family outer membrane beta-barrel protein [Opitutaceae bacterium]